MVYRARLSCLEAAVPKAHPHPPPQERGPEGGSPTKHSGERRNTASLSQRLIGNERASHTGNKAPALLPAGPPFHPLGPAPTGTGCFRNPAEPMTSWQIKREARCFHYSLFNCLYIGQRRKTPSPGCYLCPLACPDRREKKRTPGRERQGPRKKGDTITPPSSPVNCHVN